MSTTTTNKAMNVSAQDVLNFLVHRANASEDAPLRLGNVDFWHPIPGLAVGLCYSIPTHQWDVKAVQDALNAAATPCWDELVAYLRARETERSTP